MNLETGKLIEALKWRYATKRFDPVKKIPTDQWAALQEALRLAPSSYGLQPWKFYVVDSPVLRVQLREFSWGQSQVTDCSHYVVLAYRTEIQSADIDRLIFKSAELRKVDPSSMDAYRSMMQGDLVEGPRSKQIQSWAQRQTYIAMGFLLESAALLGIDSCPMEGLDPAKYDELLSLTGTGYRTVAAVALGYRHSEDKYQFAPKVRFDASEVFETR